ncbi:MAG: hypothetical protein FIB01_07285 [Gemmatimonadetes bacterium]|nr:hypothetical protein [Gemmatimonadota bacterium]
MLRSFLAGLGRRKLGHWALAYLAGAWLLLQVLDLLAQPFAWPALVLRAATVLLAIGFFAVLVIAWYHGEKGAQRVSGVELLMLTGILVIAGAATVVVTRRRDAAVAAAPPPEQPLVIMMDSPNPERVYDEETLQNNGTNADLLSDILLDLPIRRQKETIGRIWHRDMEIRRFDPDLVLIHLSAFCARDCDYPAAFTRLGQLLSYFGDGDTDFLIYSRGGEIRCVPNCEALLRTFVDSLFADAYAAAPTLRARVHVFAIRDYGSPHWRDPGTASALKVRVRDLLHLRIDRE